MQQRHGFDVTREMQDVSLEDEEQAQEGNESFVNDPTIGVSTNAPNLDHPISCKKKESIETVRTFSSASDIEIDSLELDHDLSTISSNSRCTRISCTLLFILVLLFAVVAVILAFFPSTRQIALFVFVPLLSVSMLGCIVLTFKVTCQNRIAVIETTLPRDSNLRDKNSREHGGQLGEKMDTAEPTATETAVEPQTFLAKHLPEVQDLVQECSKSFEVTRDYLQLRILRPAAAMCAPPARMSSRNMASSLSLQEILSQVDADVECCVDVHCLRDEFGAVNLTGSYKLVHNNNFEGFLKALNVPLILRKAANAARPVHTYTHIGDTFRVQFEGIVKGDTTFIVKGPPKPSSIRHYKFMDYPTYMEDKRGIMVRKIGQNPKPGACTEIVVTRRLSKNGKMMILTSRALKGNGDEVAVSVQQFARI